MLGVNQSTVSRRVSEMERRLDTTLFERTPSGHILTGAGVELLAMASTVEEEFFRIGSRVAGRDTRLSGALRVTCVDMMVDRYLAPHLASFSALHPGIDLEIVTPLHNLDLMRREADVAIRASQGPPETLIGRRLFSFGLAVYASKSLAAALPPDPDPASLDWIGLDSDAYNQRVTTANFPTAKIRHRVDGLVVLNALVREGFGVAVLACYWADAEPDLQRIYPDPVMQDVLGLWVLSHPDMRRTARVRAFTKFITEVLLGDRERFEATQPLK